MVSVVCEYDNGVGWTLYAPLSSTIYVLSPCAIDLVLVGLAINGTSSTLTSINLVVAIWLYKLVSGSQYGVYIASILLTSLILLLVIPILLTMFIMVLGDKYYNTVYFDYLYGGDAVLYQHLFWLFGHPEVYIIIIPIIAIVYVTCQYIVGSVQIYFVQCVIMCLLFIIWVGAVVWAHHMFTVGLDTDTLIYYSLLSYSIAIPSGVKVFTMLTMLSC